MKPRNVLVTGASSGIGRAIAEQLLREGRRVVLSGRDEGRLREIASYAPERASVAPFDLEDVAGIDAFVGALVSSHGPFDGVVLSSGVVRYEPLATVSASELARMYNVNAVAPVIVARAAARSMPRDGSIVFVSSTLAFRHAPTTASYSASKAALIAMAKTLALEVAERGIRVNTIAPGVVDTPMIRGAKTPEELATLTALHALGRIGTAEEVASATVALLDMPWTTGTLLTVDGGLTA